MRNTKFLVLTRNYEGDNKGGVYILREGDAPIHLKISRANEKKVQLRFRASDEYVILRDDLVEKYYAEVLPRLERGEVITADILKNLETKVKIMKNENKK